MQAVRFYDMLPDMECLAGDTLPVFQIFVDAESLNGCTMQVIVESEQQPGTAVLTKNCTTLPDGIGFQVTLTSSDTAGLSGAYFMHFRMKDAVGNSHRKLACRLFVRKTAQG